MLHRVTLERRVVNHKYIYSTLLKDTPGCVVGIATGYGLDGLRIESRWRRDFSHLSRPALGPTHSCTMGTASFPGLKSGRGMTLTPHPLLVPWSRKDRVIPLLPLWAIRTVQSLSACTWVHFTLLKDRMSHVLSYIVPV
jgi:hypothetical protein